MASFEKEARDAGAKSLTITGHAIVNKGFLSEAAARRYGFRFVQMSEDTVKLVKELVP